MSGAISANFTSRAARSIPVTLVLVDGGVRLLVEEPSQRMPDRRRLEQVGGDLVEERLERVVVVLVDEHHVGVGVLQLPSGAEAGETATEDQDARPLSIDIIRHCYLRAVQPRQSTATRASPQPG